MKSLFVSVCCLVLLVALPQSASAQSGLIHIKQGPIQPVAAGTTRFEKIKLPQGSPPWSWVKGCTATSFNGVSGPLDTAGQFVVFNVSIVGGPIFVNVICEAETLTSFEASPKTIALDGFGKRAQIQVMGTFKNGTKQPLSQATDGTTYTSSNDKIVTVSPDGQVQAVGQGSATITVKNSTTSAQVTVNAQLGPVAGLFLSPAVARMDKAGQQQPIRVLLLYANGIRRDISAQATLVSDRTSVASTTKQTVTAVGAGRANVTVTAGGQSARLLVIVDGTSQLLRLAASPNPVNLKFKGTKAQLKVTGTYSDNSTLDLTKGASGITYKSSNPGVAKVSADGEVEAVSNGNAVITIEHPAGKKPKTTVNVSVTVPTLTKLTVTPNPIRFKKVGEKTQFKVIASYNDNSTQDVTQSQLTTYTSAASTIASVSPTGEVEAVKLGQTEITIKHDTLTTKVPVQIAAKLIKSIAFARSSLSMIQNTLDVAGVTAQLQLTATYDDNSTADISGDAATSYQSSSNNIATASAKGVVFAGSSAGTATITATHQGKQATISVTITRFGFRRVTKLDLDGTIEDVAVSNTIAYVAAGSAGLHMVDVTDPTKPKLLRTIELEDNAVFVRSWGEQLLVADRKGGLHILGVHDSRIADITRTLSITGGEAYGAGFWRNRLFVAGGKAGVIAYDTTKMTAPQQLGATGAGEIIAVDADAKWLAAVGTNQVLIFDHQKANWWSGAPTRTIALTGATRVVSSGSTTTQGTFYVATTQGLFRVNEQGQSTRVATGSINTSPFDLVKAEGWLLTSGKSNGFDSAPVFFLLANPLNAVYRGFQSYAAFGSFARGRGLDTAGGYLFVAAIQNSKKDMLQIGQYRRWVDYDKKAPSVAITSPLDNSSQAEDRDLHFIVNASDDREVTKVEFRIDNKIVATKTSRPFVLSYPAPQVTASTKVVLDAVAYDPAGNKQTSQPITVTVTPVTDTTKPTIALEQPAAGEEAEIGKDLFLRARVSDDRRVQEVRFFVDGTQVSVRKRPPFVAVYNIPASTADNTSLKIRAEVVDYGGQVVASKENTITAVKLTELTADISETDSSKDNQRVVIRGRTIKIDGTHTFKSVWVDQGGVLQHSAATTSKFYTLDIKADYVKVDAKSRIDVTGLGYLAANTGGNGTVGRTIGNVTTGGAGVSQGGAHGGPGSSGRSRLPAPAPFDSLFDPRFPGGGAGQANAAEPPNGGGVIRIDAKTLRIDGVIAADGGGKAKFAPGGGGGSIYIKTLSIVGDGEVRANGGGGELTALVGSGGRVAILANDFKLFSQDNVSAIGTEAIASTPRDTYFCGGAGSVFFKSATQTFGTLIVDNGSPKTNIQVTPLPQVGKSTLTAVSRNILTNANATWEAGQLIGHYINPNIQQTKIYKITGNTATTLILDVGSDDLTTIAKIGDTYHGVLQLDQLIVRGRAQISTADQLRIGGGGIVMKDSSLTSDGLQPQVTSDFNLDGSQLTLTKPLQVRNLRLLNGSVITAPAGTSAGVSHVQITTSQLLKIDGTSKIDLKGKGYAQGNSGTGTGGNGYHHKNSTIGGAVFSAGGSHGGAGGLNPARFGSSSKTNAPYGNMFAPIEAGAGGACRGAATSCVSGAGGGSVRIQADVLELDGTIDAEGSQATSGGSGAGGSVYISARVISGGGNISANGGAAPKNSTPGGGGGGRVALVYTTLTGFDPLTQVTAYGGTQSHPTNPHAGAGTIFTKAASQTYGRLIIDHNNLPAPSTGFSTVLLGVGEGSITGLTANLLTASGASFPADNQLAGLWVKADSTKTKLFRIQSNNGTSLTTRAADGDMTQTSATGRTYRGVLRLDILVVKGKARVSTVDELNATTKQVGQDSAFQAFQEKLPACPSSCSANLNCQVFGCGANTTCISSTCQ